MKQSLVTKGIALLTGTLLLFGCAAKPLEAGAQTMAKTSLDEVISQTATDTSPNVRGIHGNEVRGVWISYLEMQTMLEKKTEAQFTTNITTAFDNIKKMGLNTVYVQVRPFGDALYKSDYFPWSYTITGTEGKNPGFDPLEIMVKEAHERGLFIEAWINPYRVRPNKEKNKALSTNNQAQIWLNEKDRSVIKTGNLISYNPASTKAQDLIVNGVKEIVKNYKVDGIHIDDYFYPVTDASFDKKEYDAYKTGGGTMSLAGWRRNNVETLIKKMYNGIKEVNTEVKFGISPQSNIDTNYNMQYLDVKKIASNTGYCDYIAPQIYFGFENKVQPYAKTLDKWDDLVATAKVDLYVGIASYKIGTYDSYAGEGSKEWQTNSDLSARMVTYAREKESYNGFILYRYDHIFKPVAAVKDRVAKENKKIEELIK